jgi:hypothetical protein
VAEKFDWKGLICSLLRGDPLSVVETPTVGSSLLLCFSGLQEHASNFITHITYTHTRLSYPVLLLILNVIDFHTHLSLTFIADITSFHKHYHLLSCSIITYAMGQMHLLDSFILWFFLAMLALTLCNPKHKPSQPSDSVP